MDSTIFWIHLKPKEIAKKFEQECHIVVSHGMVKRQLLALNYRYRKLSKQLPNGQYQNRDNQLNVIFALVAVMVQLDRLTAQRARLVKVIKMLQTPLTDSEGFIDKADHKATAPAAWQQACKASLKALKADLKSADKAITELA